MIKIELMINSLRMNWLENMSWWIGLDSLEQTKAFRFLNLKIQLPLLHRKILHYRCSLVDSWGIHLSNKRLWKMEILVDHDPAHSGWNWKQIRLLNFYHLFILSVFWYKIQKCSISIFTNLRKNNNPMSRKSFLNISFIAKKFLNSLLSANFGLVYFFLNHKL